MLVPSTLLSTGFYNFIWPPGKGGGCFWGITSFRKLIQQPKSGTCHIFQNHTITQSQSKNLVDSSLSATLKLNKQQAITVCNTIFQARQAGTLQCLNLLIYLKLQILCLYASLHVGQQKLANKKTGYTKYKNNYMFSYLEHFVNLVTHFLYKVHVTQLR